MIQSTQLTQQLVLFFKSIHKFFFSLANFKQKRNEIIKKDLIKLIPGISRTALLTSVRFLLLVWVVIIGLFIGPAREPVGLRIRPDQLGPAGVLLGGAERAKNNTRVRVGVVVVVAEEPPRVERGDGEFGCIEGQSELERSWGARWCNGSHEIKVATFFFFAATEEREKSKKEWIKWRLQRGRVLIFCFVVCS